MVFPKNITYLNISITNQCNFKCSYCYKNNKSKEQSIDMSFDDLDKILKALSLNSDRKLPLTCFISGGEPLLTDHLSLITLINKYNKIKFQISTNGSIKIEDYFINGLINKNISWVLSYDGVMCNQRMGFDKITFNHNIDILTNNEFHVHLNPTYNHNNIKNMVHIYYEELINTNKYITYGWNLAKAVTTAFPDNYYKEFTDAMFFILNDISERKYKYVPLYIKGLIGLKLVGSLSPHCYHKYRNIIDVYGNIYRCNIISQNTDFRHGNIHDDLYYNYINYNYKFNLKLNKVEDFINNYRHDFDCKLICTLHPKVYTILDTLIDEFIIKAPSNVSLDSISFYNKCYPTGFCLGTNMNAPAFNFNL
jgi:sulfatase maturation enzyme AslB (radical SAM superfamily)